MDATIYCLVDREGQTHVKDGARSYDEVARGCGVPEETCEEYRFDIPARRLLVDRATPAGAVAAQAYLDQRVGTPERLMAFAGEGHLPKGALAPLLRLDLRQPYLSACADIERKYTAECAVQGETCLDSGCSVKGEDEICLEAVLNAGIEYQQACAAEWIRMFRTPANRVDVWKN